MGLRINTNVASLAAARIIGKTQQKHEHALMALATGNRIVKPGDDAPGMIMGETLRAQISGMNKAKQNSQNAVAMIQVAEGGMHEMSSIMIRIRELGVQAASDNVSDAEREFLQVEVSQLVQEADRIAESTVLGRRKLLTGTGEELTFQVGHLAGKENTVTIKFDTDARADALGIDGIDVSDKDSALDALEDIDDAFINMNGKRANIGAMQRRLGHVVSNLDVQIENVEVARSTVMDADFAWETAQVIKTSLQQQAAVSVMAQANQTAKLVERLI